MATRRYSLTPQAAAFQVVEAVGAATVTSAIEVTIDFDAMVAQSPTMTGPQAKMMVELALQKFVEYIETKGIWPPA